MNINQLHKDLTKALADTTRAIEAGEGEHQLEMLESWDTPRYTFSVYHKDLCIIELYIDAKDVNDVNE